MDQMNEKETLEFEAYEEAYKQSYKDERREGKAKKIILGILVILVLLLAGGYVSGVVYFQDRFFFNMQVNGMDFSRQTTTEAREFVESRAADFYIRIIGEEGSEEKIYASEINFRFIANASIEELLKAQNPFTWFLSLMNSQEIYAEVEVLFDWTKCLFTS